MKSFSLDTSPREMINQIAAAREVVGGGNKTKWLVDQALTVLHDVVVNLYLEKANINQLAMMTERDKSEDDRNKSIMKKSVTNWQKTLTEVTGYVKFFRLVKWQSRVERYWGRLYDAIGKYREAIPHYQKAIKTARLDPEFIDRGFPRWLEVEGFLASAYMNSGQIKKGWEASKMIYKKYDKGEGVQLKTKDYSTWAIWKSGIPIRIGQALRNNKLLINQIDLKEYTKWLDEAEKLLYPPPGVKVWVDFQFRKNEIEAIKKELGLPHP